MNNITNFDYNKIVARIATTNRPDQLIRLGKNIRENAANDEHFAQLADVAHSRAVRLKYEAKFHTIAEGMFQAIAREFAIKGAIALDSSISGRTTLSIRANGYVGFLVRCVERTLCANNYKHLVNMGKPKLTAEYFVYRYCRHLVSADLYLQVAALFETQWLPTPALAA